MSIIGIGTDIIECLRIARMIERHGELFLGRVFTSLEIDYCSLRKTATQHYAGRWAAKESILKAMGTGWSRGIRWKDLEILTEPSGKPHVQIEGTAWEICQEKGISRILLSISHCRSHATAQAIALGTDEEEI